MLRGMQVLLGAGRASSVSLSGAFVLRRRPGILWGDTPRAPNCSEERLEYQPQRVAVGAQRSVAFVLALRRWQQQLTQGTTAISSTTTGWDEGEKNVTWRHHHQRQTKRSNEILTDEGEDDEESPQLHRVGVGQRMQLLPDLAEDAQRLLPGVHPTRARQGSDQGLEEEAAELHFRLMLYRTSQID